MPGVKFVLAIPGDIFYFSVEEIDAPIRISFKDHSRDLLDQKPIFFLTFAERLFHLLAGRDVHPGAGDFHRLAVRIPHQPDFIVHPAIGAVLGQEAVFIGLVVLGPRQFQTLADLGPVFGMDVIEPEPGIGQEVPGFPAYQRFGVITYVAESKIPPGITGIHGRRTGGQNLLQPRLGFHELGDIDGIEADHDRMAILIDDGKPVGNPLMLAVGVRQAPQGLERFPGLNDYTVLLLEFCRNFGRPEVLGGFSLPLLPGFVKDLLPGGVGEEVAPLQIADDRHAGQVPHEGRKQPLTVLQLPLRLFQVADDADGRAAQPFAA